MLKHVNAVINRGKNLYQDYKTNLHVTYLYYYWWPLLLQEVKLSLG